MVKKENIDLSNEVDRLMTPRAKKELEPILTATFQQFLIRYLDLRDNVISTQLSETLSPMLLVLEKLSDGQDKLASDLSDMKIDLGHVKCDIIGIRQQVQSVRENYERLEIKQLKIQDAVQMLSENYSAIDQRTNDHRMWMLRLVLVILAVMVALGLFIWLFPFIHNYRMLSLLSWA
jgi:septation ring formation regulator EzrA